MMTEKKPKKSKMEIPTRTPQKRVGIFDNLGRGKQQNVKHPMSDFLGSATRPTENEETTQPNPTQDDITQPETTQPNITQPNQVEISPIKDFTKVPNSITKKAIPQKLFKGLSKHTYDVLYRHTRGSIKPTRKIQLTKGEIMKLTGLSFNTIQTHIKYLRESGLLKVELNIGKHEGSIYEIIVPEEIGSNPTQDNPTQPNPTQDETTLKTQPDTIQNLGIVGSSNPLENKGLTDSVRLSLNTNTIDDEWTRKIGDFFRAKFGRDLTEKEKQNLRSVVADAMEKEFESAASNASTISDAAAFFAEHLRRRLANPTDKQKSLTDKKLSPTDKPAKFDREKEIEPYKAESLSEEGREQVLKTMREFIEKGQRDFVMNSKDTYTEIDWKWLMQELEK